jgi:hypothetical protein
MAFVFFNAKECHLSFFFIMYFSLPEYIPPHPLGGTRVRKQWSALYYFIACYNTSHVKFKTHKFVYIVIVIVIINIYKCHCYPDSCKHFRLNNVTNYGEYNHGSV